MNLSNQNCATGYWQPLAMAKKSVFSILLLLFKLLFIFPPNLIWNLIRIGIVAQQRSLPLREYMVVALSRNFFSTFQAYEFGTVLPSTSKAFATWHKANTNLLLLDNSHQVTSTLDDGVTKIHWIRGSKSSSTTTTSTSRKVLLFLHGGGYFAPSPPQYFDWCLKMSQHLGERKLDVDIAVLEYLLTPDHQYPTQLRQGRNALAYLIENEGLHPNNIIIGGDSAGGNLTTALISHLLHPHPDIEPVNLKQPLAGAFLVSPWLTSDQSTTSFRNNASIDILTASGLKEATAIFSDHEKDPSRQSWIWALHNETTWWSRLEQQINSLFINVGDQELFRDHVIQFAHMLQHHSDISPNARLRIELDVGHGEAHDHVTTLILAGAKTNRPLDRLHAWLDKVWAR